MLRAAPLSRPKAEEREKKRDYPYTQSHHGDTAPSSLRGAFFILRTATHLPLKGCCIPKNGAIRFG